VDILGQDMRLMVDSGSAGSYITDSAYNRLHLNQTYNDPGYYADGLGGRVDISAFALVNMNFGAVRLKDEVVAILTRPISPATGPDVIDGIMGYDILQYFDIGLDLPHKRITLYSPRHCTITETPWEGDYAPMPFRRPQDASPVVVETIDGKNFNVTIDTGGCRSLIMQASLNRNGVVPEVAPVVLTTTGTGMGGLKVHIIKAQFSSIGIGAEVYSDAWLALDTTPASELNEVSDGLLGEDYLTTHRVFIANSTGTVYLGLGGQ
jgi:hypothetical protein